VYLGINQYSNMGGSDPNLSFGSIVESQIRNKDDYPQLNFQARELGNGEPRRLPFEIVIDMVDWECKKKKQVLNILRTLQW
jgi:hypothetical protein